MNEQQVKGGPAPDIGFPDMADHPLWWLWGKAQRSSSDSVGPEWHPLVCHMLDVMNVADAMLEQLHPEMTRLLLSPLGGRESALPWLRLLIALHDMGKATPGFQRKWTGNLAEQERYGLTNRTDRECHRHGVTGTAILSQLLQNSDFLGAAALSRPKAVALARAVASHHGEFARDEAVENCTFRDLSRHLRDGQWRNVHLAIGRLLFSVAVGECPLLPISGEPQLVPGFVMALAGLTSVADWLGSDSDNFKYTALPVSLEAYQATSKARARDTLARVGWVASERRAPRAFSDLFPFGPRSLQIATEQLVANLSGPSLIIIESTMGDGKTEAALLVSEVLAPRIGQSGLYIGLPTQATANQMLGRVQRFLENTHRGRANLQLVHGDAVLSERFHELKLRAIYGDERSSNVCAETWFSQSKRALLASHAVGTVDQGLMGVLQTRHGFVRLFGLAGKTVILDEVHAYDTYTSELLDRLVSWLSVLGATVVVLSATLPRQRREALIRAYGADVPDGEAQYPRVTAATRGARATSVGTQPSRSAQCIAIRQRDDDEEGTANEIGLSLAEGGCVAWICNTVKRAQQAYAALKRMRASGVLPEDTDLTLLHSRFLRKDRQRLEQKVEQLYGPEAKLRPFRGVVVGTQVLEQSLDIDFDLMISDLAPIDLVLQRVGRLHRHNRTRPAPHHDPTLWLVMPAVSAMGPDFGSVARVYEPDVMFRTWWELQGTTHFQIPGELESWIERVYGDQGSSPSDQDLKASMTEAIEIASEKRRADWNEAQQKLLFAPNQALHDDAFGNTYSHLEEDESGELHAQLCAQTRLAEPSVDVVCVWNTDLGLQLERCDPTTLDLDRMPSLAEARGLVAHSLKMEVRRLKGLEAIVVEPKRWSDSSMLRYKKLLVLGDDAECAGITLDPELGLVFARPSTGSRCPS